MTEEFSEIVEICIGFSENLRENILAGNATIENAQYSLLFWPPWVEKLNALIKRLENTTPQADLERLHSKLMRVGLDYLTMDTSLNNRSDAVISPP